MKNQFKFTIDDMDMDIDFNDAGPWRSYSLTTFGDNYDDLFDNSYVSETDSDGGEIRTYSLKSAENKITACGEKMIEHYLDKRYEAIIEGQRENAADYYYDQMKDKEREIESGAGVKVLINRPDGQRREK